MGIRTAMAQRVTACLLTSRDSPGLARFSRAHSVRKTTEKDRREPIDDPSSQTSQFGGSRQDPVRHTLLIHR
jgi:hypothetical protein